MISKITDCKTFIENDRVFTSLKYCVETEYGCYDITVPKIPLNFKHNPRFIFKYYDTTLNLSLKEVTDRLTGNSDFSIPPKLISIVLLDEKTKKNGVHQDINGKTLYIARKNDKRRKMTIKEIEKELGYMIEVANDGKE